MGSRCSWRTAWSCSRTSKDDRAIDPIRNALRPAGVPGWLLRFGEEMLLFLQHAGGAARLGISATGQLGKAASSRRPKRAPCFRTGVAGTPGFFRKCVVTKVLKVLCFDTLLQVFILLELHGAQFVSIGNTRFTDGKLVRKSETREICIDSIGLAK